MKLHKGRRGVLRLGVVACLVAGIALGAVACGDDDDSGDATPTTSDTTSATATTATTAPTGSTAAATTGTTAPTTTAASAGNPVTRSLQKDLRSLKFYDGPVNGQYDAATVAAVKAFQQSADLPQDGVAGPQTHVAIDFELGRNSSQTVALMQRDLAALCHYSGPANGVYTSATEAAVKEFQGSVGIAADGQFGPETAVALIRETGSAPSSCASTPATPAATHTGPATPTATVSVRGPAYSKTFEVARCTPRGESGALLVGGASGGFTIRIDVPEGGKGTLAIGGGDDEDGINLRGDVEELSVGDAGDLRGSGVFTPPPSGKADFTIAGRCA